jgi:SAM-dependent methyltransferase
MTGHDDAERLAAANLAHTVARVVSSLGVTVRTVLDLGCGTGRDLAAFTGAYQWAGVGVDLQPALLTHGRTVRPGLDLRVGDLRTVRLGRTFDLITCLGNVLAYLHTDAELHAAAATFAAHAQPGTVLTIHTLTSPPPAKAGPNTAHVETVTTQARVTTCAEWDAARMIHTTRRTWQFADHHETDHLVRRVTPIAQLHEMLTATGWVPTGRPPAHMITALFGDQTRNEAISPIAGPDR